MEQQIQLNDHNKQTRIGRNVLSFTISTEELVGMELPFTYITEAPAVMEMIRSPYRIVTVFVAWSHSTLLLSIPRDVEIALTGSIV